MRSTEGGGRLAGEEEGRNEIEISVEYVARADGGAQISLDEGEV